MEQLAAEVTRKLAQARPGSLDADRLRGLAAGLTGSLRRLQLLRPGMPSGSEMRIAGLLAGNLQGTLIAERSALGEEPLLTATVYASAIAGWLRAKGHTTDPERLLAAHTSACIYLERKGRTIDEPGEQELFDWLLDQAGAETSEPLRAKYERIRLRRRERTSAP